ncbi:MAG TPA: cyclic pyranopterin monophosphate synthase MoaC [Longimicrobiales bacterium]|nr:cyclic pyranopterin monophosphate synthase MoaC [Longimicrobiales bacterium]
MSSAPADRLTHLAEDGRARMVDVGGKAETERTAVAIGSLRMARATLDTLRAGRTPKGDPLLVAQVAGIQAAKRTADLIPLCHPLQLTQVDVQLEPDEALPGVRVRATVRVTGRTGVEMEALTAASIALLTAYDMLKAVDRDMVIDAVRVEAKSGGRSGTWSVDTQAATDREPPRE